MLGAGDLDFEKLADGCGGIENDAAIDFGGVVFGAGEAGLIGQDAETFALAALGELGGDFLLELHGLAEASVTDFGRDLIFHFGGAGTVFAGVGKDAEAFKAAGGDEFEEAVKVFLGFSGEAHDESRADAEVGDAGAEAIEKVFDVLAGGFASHGLE